MNVRHIDGLDETAEQLRRSLSARAELVTDESLALPPTLSEPDRRPRRWPVLVAAAAVIAVAAGTALALISADRGEPDPPAWPPPVIGTSTSSSPPVSTSSPSASSSTSTRTPPPARSPSATPPPPTTCTGTCVIQTVSIAGDVLELVGEPARSYPPFADPAYDGTYVNWRLRIRGGPEIGRGPRVDADGGVYPGDGTVGYQFVSAAGQYAPAPLWCDVVSRQPACLLRTSGMGDTVGHFGVVSDDPGWRFTRAEFGHWMGAESIVVRDIGEDGALEVVAVEHGDERVFALSWSARVYRWDGTEYGCVARVATAEELPGWPQVAPDLASLDPGHCLWTGNG